MNTIPIELHQLFSQISSGGNPAIQEYRRMMYKYTICNNDVYIFNIDMLKLDGINIPNDIQEFKCNKDSMDWMAYQCCNLGIDPFNEILLCLINKTQILN